MQFLTSASNFRGGGSADPPDTAFSSPWLSLWFYRSLATQPQTKPDSQQTLALHEFFGYLLTYLLTVLQEALVIVDKMYFEVPDMMKDAYWYQKLIYLPFTEATAVFKKVQFAGSAAGVQSVYSFLATSFSSTNATSACLFLCFYY